MKKRGQNEGSIRQRKDGTFEARFTAGYNAEGKQIRKSIYGKTKTEVRKKLNQLLNDIENDKYYNPKKITLGKWIEIWLFEFKQNTIKQTSFDAYYQTMKSNFNTIKNIHLKNLTRMDLQKELNLQLQTKSKATISKNFAVLKSCLREAENQKMISGDIYKSLKAPKKEKNEVEIFTLDEQKVFVEGIAGCQYKTEFMTLLTCGLRVGELLALKWENIDFEKKELTVKQNCQKVKNYTGNTPDKFYEIKVSSPKTSTSIRTVPLLEKMIHLLKMHKNEQNKKRIMYASVWKDNDLVFPTMIGDYNTRFALHKEFKKVLKQLNIKEKKVHSLRHTFASRGLENGIDLKVMQEFLGHNSIRITADVYSHVMPNTKHEQIKKIADMF